MLNRCTFVQRRSFYYIVQWCLVKLSLSLARACARSYPPNPDDTIIIWIVIASVDQITNREGILMPLIIMTMLHLITLLKYFMIKYESIFLEVYTLRRFNTVPVNMILYGDWYENTGFFLLAYRLQWKYWFFLAFLLLMMVLLWL